MADALDALKSLQSVTTAGLTYREYSPRVLDAKVRVDRYLQGEGRNRAFQVQIEQAMDLYVLASAAWSSKITKEYSLGDDARVELCPVANRLREEQSRIVDLLPRETARGLAVAHSVSVLWDCAYERIAEMDSVLKSN